MQRRLDALPLSAFFAAVAATGALAGAAVGAVSGRRLDLLALLVRALVLAGVLTWLAARQRWQSGGAGAVAAVGAATRSGILPADAEPAVWRPALLVQRRKVARARWLGPVVFGSLAVSGTVLAVALSSPAWAVIAVGGLLLGLLGPLGARRALPRIDGLLDQLDQRD